MNQPVKLPEPVMKAEKEWEREGFAAFGTVMYDKDDKIFKMWYISSPKELGLIICYATSRSNSHAGVDRVAGIQGG